MARLDMKILANMFMNPRFDFDVVAYVFYDDQIDASVISRRSSIEKFAHKAVAPMGKPGLVTIFNFQRIIFTKRNPLLEDLKLENHPEILLNYTLQRGFEAVKPQKQARQKVYASKSHGNGPSFVSKS